MAIARVVSFEGVDRARLDQMNREIEAGKALAIVFFESEDDYTRGHEILDAMPAGDTPGRRTAVTRYDVAVRMTL
jgi:hypothetical protein